MCVAFIPRSFSLTLRNWTAHPSHHRRRRSLRGGDTSKSNFGAGVCLCPVFNIAAPTFPQAGKNHTQIIRAILQTCYVDIHADSEHPCSLACTGMQSQAYGQQIAAPEPEASSRKFRLVEEEFLRIHQRMVNLAIDLKPAVSTCGPWLTLADLG